MEFLQLTKANFKNYTGNQIIFKMNDKPTVATLCNMLGEHFLISSLGNKNYLLSVKHPTFVIIMVNDNRSANTLHYSMNFLKAFPNNISPYVGNYVVVQTNGNKVHLAKIKSVSKSLCYILVKDLVAEKRIDIRSTPCYVII
jgi:hypothetical protein